MLVFDKVVDEGMDVDLLEMSVGDVELVYLHRDDLDDAGWALGVDDPKSLISILAPEARISCQRMLFCR